MTALFRACSVLFAVIICASAVTHAQFVKAPTDLTTKQGAAGIEIRYKLVPPEICETTPNVTSYAGYSDVDGKHIFWWFFERRHDPENAPLTIWFNGGPAASSIRGALQEFGPCLVRKNITLLYNQFSWSNASNLLFIDQPVGTGLSYINAVPGFHDPRVTENPVQLEEEVCPEGYNLDDTPICGTFSERDIVDSSNSTYNAEPVVWKAVQGFVGAFPQYSKNGVNVAAESYGGRFGPLFAKFFQDQDETYIQGAQKLNVKALVVNNAVLDPVLLYKTYYNFTVWPGNPYVKDILNKTWADEMYRGTYGPNNCIAQLQKCQATKRLDVCEYAFDFCYQNPFDLYNAASRLDFYDVRQMDTDDYPGEDFAKYMNREEVQIGVGAYTNFSSQTRYVADMFRQDGDFSLELGVAQAVRDLLNKGVSVLIWAGDADYICNYYSNHEFVKKLNYDGFDSAGFVSLETPDEQTHGEVRQAGFLTFASIFDAGHLLPAFQPEAALVAFNRTIMGFDVATGTKRVDWNYRTVGRENMRTPTPTKTPADIKKEAKNGDTGNAKTDVFLRRIKL